jgi:hypothetical protein
MAQRGERSGHRRAPGTEGPRDSTGRQPVDSQQQSPISGSIAEVVLPWRVDKLGLWSFQVIANPGGMARPVGELQNLPS